jgi:hypothetical protein
MEISLWSNSHKRTRRAILKPTGSDGDSVVVFPGQLLITRQLREARPCDLCHALIPWE